MIKPNSYHLENDMYYTALEIQLFGHCIATWYGKSQSLVKLTEIGTSCGRG